MPTESEFDKYNRPLHTPEIKQDPAPRYRLAFLDRVNICWPCVTIRTVLLYGLALYGLYSLIF